jgi:prephenate dehydrogenase
LTADFRNSKLEDLTFAIVGMGLIGGSYAKALRRLKVKKILGLDISHGILKACLNSNMIDEMVEEDGSPLRQADVIICCVYPGAIVDFVRANAANFRPGMLLTDATGIKGGLPEKVQALLPAGCEFISGHPMAGRQGSGLGMAAAEIFDGANYIIVPAPHNTPAAVAWLEHFAMALGCRRTVQVAAAEHDKIIAYTSNLPHTLAVSLVNSASYTENTKYFIAGSFRDATRVADINPELWSDLFLANRENVIEEIEKYQQQLERWLKALRENDGETLQQMMRDSAAKRRELY